MKLLTNQQAAELIGLKPATLDVWRNRGQGPRFVKVGRLVRYSEEEVVTWLHSQTRRSTSDTGSCLDGASRVGPL